MSTNEHDKEYRSELEQLLAEQSELEEQEEGFESDVDLDAEEIEEEDNQPEPESEPEKEVEPEVDPWDGLDREKYANKKEYEIAKMHYEAEKYAHQNKNRLDQAEAELARYKKLTDEFMSRQLDGESKTEEEQLTVDHLLDNPQDAIARVVQSVLQQSSAQQPTPKVTKLSEAEFLNKHPDAEKIGADPEFATWVQGDAARLASMQQAIAVNDWDAADEMLTTFKEVNSKVQAAKQEADQEREKGAKILGGTGSSSGTNRSNGKIYSEAKLIKLYNENRDLYNEIAEREDLDRAYEEGRVR